MLARLLTATAILCTLSLPIGYGQSAKRLEEFHLVDGLGQPIELDPQAAIHVIAFLGVECPVSRSYAPRLQKLADDYEGRGVRVIGIDSNLHDSRSDVDALMKSLSLKFPIAKDYDQHVANQLGATRVPEVFVVDEFFAVRYQGRIDDQFQPGLKRSEASREDLKIAIDELLSGKSVTTPETTAVGCLIARRQNQVDSSDVTYCKSIAPILNRHCVECHRPGEIGPFSLTNYDEVLGWSDMMLEVIAQHRMPPWNADKQHGSFKNARQMPLDDRETLRKWVADGMPYGDVRDLPAMPEFIDGWRLARQPDFAIAMRERPFPVPASGTVEYQYFVVDPGFKEDRWVTAAQVIPGNASVVHHAIVFIRPPDGADFRGIGWLTAYVPGQRATAFPPGYARRIPAGSKFVFQMHYTPNGTPHSDQTKIGMLFADGEEITHEVTTTIGIDQEFEIPPNAEHHEVHGMVRRIPRDSTLLAIMPHMHVRGKAFRLTRTHLDQSSILLDVPHYDFNWQHTYELQDPLPLSSDDTISFTAAFDNSAHNPANPDANSYVMWGDQTWEEMAVVFLEVAQPLHTSPSPAASVAQPSAASEAPAPPADDYLPTELAAADAFFKRFDANKDGAVATDEVTRVFKDYGFWSMDGNGDRRITRDEFLAAVKSRRR